MSLIYAVLGTVVYAEHTVNKPDYPTFTEMV